jgi:hypothetical protein
MPQDVLEDILKFANDENSKVVVKWQKGDILIMDNLKLMIAR